jgi:hypothetical protein
VTTQQQTQSTFPVGVVLAVLGAVAVIAAGFVAIRIADDGPSSSNGVDSALGPTFSTEISPAERHIAEMQQHEDLTNRDFGPAPAPAPVPEQTVEQQIADAIAELENGLAAQMMR